ncbi:MAG: hypothetical protein WDA06_00485 [Phenylobacterium sp.]
MEQNKRVKILESSYSEKENLVFWKIETLDEHKVLTLAWLPLDLSIAMGFKDKEGKPLVLSTELLNDFCQKMQGKEINLQMKAALKEEDFKDLKDKSLESYQNLHDKLDAFPFFEVEKKLKESEG